MYCHPEQRNVSQVGSRVDAGGVTFALSCMEGSELDIEVAGILLATDTPPCALLGSLALAGVGGPESLIFPRLYLACYWIVRIHVP